MHGAMIRRSETSLDWARSGTSCSNACRVELCVGEAGRVEVSLRGVSSATRNCEHGHETYVDSIDSCDGILGGRSFGPASTTKKHNNVNMDEK